MKVYGVFKSEMVMPFLHETLIDLYADKQRAKSAAEVLNLDNTSPMERDSYGPMHGCEYFVVELDVK